MSAEDRAKLRAESAARYRERHPEVPVVENIDARILATIESGDGRLDMSTWHTCKTTHCLAGWAITLGGEKGRALEKQYGPAPAGAMIYRASIGRVPHFYATNDRAIEDLKRRVAEAGELAKAES